MAPKTTAALVLVGLLPGAQAFTTPQGLFHHSQTPFPLSSCSSTGTGGTDSRRSSSRCIRNSRVSSSSKRQRRQRQHLMVPDDNDSSSSSAAAIRRREMVSVVVAGLSLGDASSAVAASTGGPGTSNAALKAKLAALEAKVMGVDTVATSTATGASSSAASTVSAAAGGGGSEAVQQAAVDAAQQSASTTASIVSDAADGVSDGVSKISQAVTDAVNSSPRPSFGGGGGGGGGGAMDALNNIGSALRKPLPQFNSPIKLQPIKLNFGGFGKGMGGGGSEGTKAHPFWRNEALFPKGVEVDREFKGIELPKVEKFTPPKISWEIHGPPDMPSVGGIKPPPIPPDAAPTVEEIFKGVPPEFLDNLHLQQDRIQKLGQDIRALMPRQADAQAWFKNEVLGSVGPIPHVDFSFKAPQPFADLVVETFGREVSPEVVLVGLCLVPVVRGSLIAAADNTEAGRLAKQGRPSPWGVSKIVAKPKPQPKVVKPKSAAQPVKATPQAAPVASTTSSSTSTTSASPSSSTTTTDSTSGLEALTDLAAMEASTPPMDPALVKLSGELAALKADLREAMDISSELAERLLYMERERQELSYSMGHKKRLEKENERLTNALAEAWEQIASLGSQPIGAKPRNAKAAPASKAKQAPSTAIPASAPAPTAKASAPAPKAKAPSPAPKPKAPAPAPKAKAPAPAPKAKAPAPAPKAKAPAPAPKPKPKAKAKAAPKVKAPSPAPAPAPAPVPKAKAPAPKAKAAAAPKPAPAPKAKAAAAPKPTPIKRAAPAPAKAVAPAKKTPATAKPKAVAAAKSPPGNLSEDDEWRDLSASGFTRKTVAALKAFCQARDLQVPKLDPSGQPTKKAEYLAVVSDYLNQ